MTHEEMRAALAALDKRLRQINPNAFVTLTVWPTRFIVNVHCTNFSRRDREAEANDPAEALQRISAALDNHDPALFMKTIGVES